MLRGTEVQLYFNKLSSFGDIVRARSRIYGISLISYLEMTRLFFHDGYSVHIC